MKKYNILLVSHSSGMLGAEQSLLCMLEGIDTGRFNPIVVCPGCGPLTEEIKKRGFTLDIIPVKWWISGKTDLLRVIYRIPFHIYSTYRISRLIRKYGIDLVHINSVVTFEGALAARLMRKPCIWHIREIFVNNITLRPVLSVRNTLRVMDCLADKLICISNAVKKRILEYGSIAGEKLQVVYNGVDSRKYDKSGGKLFRKRLIISDEVFLVGIVGSVQRKKGHEDFVAAAHKVISSFGERCKCVFAVVGEGDKNYVDHLKNVAKEFGIEKHIIFTGFCTDMPEVMNSLDLLAAPSLEEPFGRVIIEAMAAGKPVVAYDSGGIPEIVADGITGILVPQGNPESLAEAIGVLMMDNKKAKAMGVKGKQRVRELFGADTYVSDIEDIYLELLEYKKSMAKGSGQCARQV